jgi:hypothetical protein
MSAPQFCPHCGKEVLIAYPVEPLWSLDDCAALLMTSKDRLVKFIGYHKAALGPALYRTLPSRPGGGPQRWRYLPASDIRTLRNIMYSPIRYRGKVPKV